MNPSTQEVLRSCVQNLEELVIPEVTSPHGKSALMCIRMLMNHVILRLDGEGEGLATDCREKRALLSALVAEGAATSAVAADVEALCAQDEPAFTPIADLTARDEAWKRVTERMLETAGADVRARIRSQLAAQIDRENAWCAPALDGPMF